MGLINSRTYFLFCNPNKHSKPRPKQNKLRNNASRQRRRECTRCKEKVSDCSMKLFEMFWNKKADWYLVFLAELRRA